MRLLAAPAAIAVLVLTSASFSVVAQEAVPAYVHDVLDALQSGDEQRIRDLLRFTRVACEAQPEGLSPTPQCAGGEPEGTLVDTMPTGTCEGAFLRVEHIQLVIDDLTLPDIEVVGVYHLRDIPGNMLFRGDFVAIVTGLHDAGGADGPSEPLASAVYLGDGGITGLSRGCATTVPGFIDAVTVGDPLDLTAPAALPDTGSARPAGSTSNAALLATALAAVALLTIVAGALAPSRARR